MKYPSKVAKIGNYIISTKEDSDVVGIGLFNSNLDMLSDLPCNLTVTGSLLFINTGYGVSLTIMLLCF